MKIYIIQFINYTLSFLMWMILGRIFLTLMIGQRDVLFMRAFMKVTEPIYRVTRRILPFLKDTWIPAGSVLLIIVLRIALVVIFKPATSR